MLQFLKSDSFDRPSVFCKEYVPVQNYPMYKTDTTTFPRLILYVWSDYLSSWYLIVNLLWRFYSWPVETPACLGPVGPVGGLWVTCAGVLFRGWIVCLQELGDNQTSLRTCSVFMVLLSNKPFQCD